MVSFKRFLRFSHSIHICYTSYGIIDPYVPPAHHGCDPTQINVLTFRWDPTRDTGVFIKVNCISTEFTPKKHGGEKGVPFRLQVETYTDDSGTPITSGILCNQFLATHIKI